jgi:hypothetical protein
MDPYHRLALQVVIQAAKDAGKGQEDAKAWLKTTGVAWLDLAGFDGPAWLERYERNGNAKKMHRMHAPRQREH